MFRGLFLALFLSLTAQAANFDRKVGIFNAQKLISEASEGRDAKKEIEIYIEIKQGELQALRAKIEESHKVLEAKNNKFHGKNTRLLTEEAKSSLMREIQEGQRDLQKMVVDLRQGEMKLQQEVGRREAVKTQEIAKKAFGIVEKLAKKKDLDVVFEKNTVVYVKNPVDITGEVISAYEKEWKKEKEQKKKIAKKQGNSSTGG